MYSVPKLEDYSPEALDAASRELLQALEQESAAVQNDADLKAFRDRWMARKSGVLTQINDTWLKAAPAANKRDIGQKVNQLRQPGGRDHCGSAAADNRCRRRSASLPPNAST